MKARSKNGWVLKEDVRTQPFRGTANRTAVAQPKGAARPAPKPPRPELLPAKMRGGAAQAKSGSIGAKVPRPELLPARMRGMVGQTRAERGPDPRWSGAPRPELLPGMGPAGVGGPLRAAQARSSHGVSTSPIPSAQRRGIGEGRSPYLAKAGPRHAVQRSTSSEELACTTFVVAPTRSSYDEENERDVRSELGELTTMAEKDIAFLKSQHVNVCLDVLYTGAPSSAALAKYLEALSSSNPQTPKEIVFTAHGSPGRNGKIGMGYDQQDKPDYRVNAMELVKLLQSLGIEALYKHRLHFYFRCCNSAYAVIDCFKKKPADAKVAILEQSFIAGFYEIMAKLGCAHLSVTGFRGYYYPAVKKPELSTDKGKTKLPISAGTVTIDEQGDVNIPGDIWKLKNTVELNEKVLA